MKLYINKWRMYFILLMPIILLGQSNKINDIISPLKLISGKADTLIISDLFYAPDYNLNFLDNKNISVHLEKEKNLLIVKANPDFEGFSTVEFRYRNVIYSIPFYAKNLNQYKFSYKPEKNIHSVNLFGIFNNWDRNNLPMKLENGIYSSTLELEPGRYQYKYFVDGEEVLDPVNKETVPNGLGGYNSVAVVPDLHNEKVFLHKLKMNLISSGTDFRFYFETEKEINLSANNVIALFDNHKIENKFIQVQGNIISIKASPAELKKAIMMRVVVDVSGLASNMQVIPISNGKPNNNSSSFDWHDANIYSIMIDRFNDGDKKNDLPIKHDSLSWKANYNGGDFTGITKKIKEGYFKSLGVNTLWISPVNDNTDLAFREFPTPHRWFTGYHGYWPISENKVEEKFGSFKDLKELINTAHQHGIKILLDYVSHHVHQEHPFFKNHPEWFGTLKLPDGRLNLRMWDEQRLTTWFEPYMPSFDFQKSDEATNVMSDNAIWWLKQTGADGFRHDAVKHVPNKFWRTLTYKLKKELEVPLHKNVYQIGETFGNYDLVNSYVNNGQLSGQFNFEQYNSAQAVFIDSMRSFKDLDAEIKKGLDVFGQLNLMGNIMDSHDKNRYMAYADGDLTLSEWNATEIGWNNPPKVDHPSSYEKAELYYAYMFSVPGLPVIYYGSEFGMTGASDPDNRRMMRFGNDLNENEKKMLKVVSSIAKLRMKNSSLRYGDYYSLKADQNIFAYIRSDFYERTLIVLNKSGVEQKVELSLPSFYSSKLLKNLEDDSQQKILENKIHLSLKPRGWMIYKIK